MSSRPMTTAAPARRSQWIPWLFVGAFGVVVAVNGILITQAVRTYTGTTTTAAYDRGRSYGEVLAEAARQKALGWKSHVTREAGGVALSVQLPDGSALPADAQVSGLLQRPLERATIALDFQPAAPGTWRAAAAERPAAGAWEAVLTVTRGADRMELRERLVFP